MTLRCTRVCRIALLTAGAVALNWVPLPIPGGAVVLLAPFLYMPAVLVLRPPAALVVVGVALLPTLSMLGHPFVLVGAVAEALWLSILRNRVCCRAIGTDLLYWVVVGLPLTVLLYGGIFDLPRDIATIVIVKQFANQLLAVGLADFLLSHTFLGAWLGDTERPRARLRGVVFSFVFVLAMVPLVLMIVGLAMFLHLRDQRESRAVLTEAAQRRAQQIDFFLQSQLAVVDELAGVLGRGGGEARVLLEETRRSHPHFITMLVADAEGRIVQTAPAERLPEVRNSSVADREYFTAAKATRRPYVSGVFRGRGLGRDVLVAISAPILDGQGRFRGIVEASVEIQRFGALVAAGSRSSPSETVLADAAGRVIYADPGTSLIPLLQLRHFPQWPLVQKRGEGGPLIFDAPNPAGVKTRYVAYASRATVIDAVVIAERPLLAGITGLEWLYLIVGVAIAAILATAILVTRAARARFARPLEHFAHNAEEQAATGQPRPIAGDTARMPYEVDLVFSAFNRLAIEVQRAHDLLARSNRELDARVVERTRELEEARRLAEAASRSKTEFLAMTSHEIRTPLNAIIGLADTLVDSSHDELEARRLRTIRDAGGRLVTVLNDLLDLSRVEAGKLELHIAPVEIGQLCRDLHALFAAQAEQRGLRLELDLRGALPIWVQTDGSRLQQVLINLLANGLKFTREGSVRLVAEAREEGAAILMRMAVVDTGPGIPVDKQAQLFEPYVQLKSAVSTSHGAGLGLAISRRLVQLLGGQLELRSDGRRGAEFSFSLALARGAPPAARPAPAAAATRRLRILAADDNPANQEVLRSFLEHRCERLEIVDCAEAAVERLRTETFDVALIDLEMPGGDGFSVASAVRSWTQGEASRRCALYAVSAHPRDQVWDRCAESGFDGFIDKPIGRQELLRTLEREPAPDTGASR